MLNVVSIRQKTCNGVVFKFAEVQGTPADHSSWWSFDDEQVVRDRHWHIKPGEVVLDIGAAFGSYTLPALAMGGLVIAFSPADFDTELLQKNLELNPELAKRCVVVRDGIHKEDGWFDPDASHLATTSHRPIGPQWLKVRSIDSFLAERPGVDKVDWIKMDIEGAEFGALQGAVKTLQKYKPKILVENHNFHEPDMERIVSRYMFTLGYRCDGPYPHGAVSHTFFHMP